MMFFAVQEDNVLARILSIIGAKYIVTRYQHLVGPAPRLVEPMLDHAASAKLERVERRV
jgi:hypothetical protein